MSLHLKSLWLLCCMMIAIYTSPADAKEPVFVYEGAPTPVDAKDLIPHLKKDDGYSEKYTFNAEFSGSDRFYFSYQITNLGAGEFKMTAKGSLKLGDRTFSWKTDELEYGDQEWKSSKNELNIEVKGTRLSGTMDALKFEVKQDDFQIEILFEPIAKAWKPRNGKVLVGNQKKVNSYIVLPLTKASGSFKKGDEVVVLNGKGYGTHSWGQLGVHEQFAWTTQFRGVNEEKDETVYFRELKTNGDFEAKHVFYLLVTQKDQVLAQCFDGSQINLTKEYTDAKHENQYRIKENFVLTCQDPFNGKSIELSFQAGAMDSRKNPLSKYSWMVRKAAELVSKPMEYVYKKASYEVKVAGQTIKGSNGMYEVNYLNAE